MTSTTRSVAAGLDDVQRGERAARCRHGRREGAGGVDRGRRLGADGDRVPGARCRHVLLPFAAISHHGSLLLICGILPSRRG